MYSSPLLVSEYLLMTLGTRLFVRYKHRLPQDVPVLVVSNHRSFMDPFVLMKALAHPLRFACHHYMGQVPLLKDIVHWLGCFPLQEPQHRQYHFLQQATQLLQSQQWVGVFPEGGQPMVHLTKPGEMTKFNRGFAHVALSAPVSYLAVLPVAIASQVESVTHPFPLRLLHLVDPSEPLFDQPGWHPVVTYHQVEVLIGNPYWINTSHRQQYHGKQAKKVVTDLTTHCHGEISQLLA